ncbi:MAG: DUF5752 family protein [Candidatus Woesearchaeota archaeon]|jgi:hypothetical protein
MSQLRINTTPTLNDCSADKTFWTHNGVVCRNIHELANNISSMNDYNFKYHVNKDNKKNDFAEWIRHVIGDDVLAERLYAIKEKDLYADIIKERIKELEYH